MKSRNTLYCKWNDIKQRQRQQRQQQQQQRKQQQMYRKKKKERKKKEIDFHKESLADIIICTRYTHIWIAFAVPKPLIISISYVFFIFS